MTLFSSVASLLGSAGQANYAAANGMMDEMAVGMQDQGRGVTAVQWGPWHGAGMAESLGLRMQRLGLGMVKPLQGLQVLQQLLSGLAAPILAAAPLDLAMLRDRSSDAAAFVSYDAGLADASTIISGELHLQTAVIAQQLAVGEQEQPSAGQRSHGQISQALVTRIVGDILGQVPSPEEPLMAAGLDSLGAIELKNGLEAAFGVSLPSTLAFDYPTATALATHIGSLISTSIESAPAADSIAPLTGPHLLTHFVPDVNPLRSGSNQGGNAVVGVQSLIHSHQGVVGVGPDQVGDALGLDASEVVPLARWDVESQPPIGGTPALRFGAFLKGIDMFDAALFSTSDKEAVLMDPQQRLLLEACAVALFEAPAHCRAAELRKSAGVFVGITSTEYGTHPTMPHARQWPKQYRQPLRSPKEIISLHQQANLLIGFLLLSCLTESQSISQAFQMANDLPRHEQSPAIYVYCHLRACCVICTADSVACASLSSRSPRLPHALCPQNLLLETHNASNQEMPNASNQMSLRSCRALYQGSCKSCHEAVPHFEHSEQMLTWMG